jgi:hypothetical protein
MISAVPSGGTGRRIASLAAVRIPGRGFAQAARFWSRRFWDEESCSFACVGEFWGLKSSPEIMLESRFFAAVAVAQLVESRIVIPVVVGSSPISHPKNSFEKQALTVTRKRLFCCYMAKKGRATRPRRK